jgi:adenine-specific DNA-methyltransferase
VLEQLKITNPIDDIIAIQGDFLTGQDMEVRKSLGQFFTGSIVSDYMASLVKKPTSKVVRILDAGAGAGILTASTALHCLEEGCKTVHAVLYELDSEAIASLKRTLTIVENTFYQQQASFTYEIHCEDFILSRPDQHKNIQHFDISVINPPYFKYSVKESSYAKKLADLYRGDPNIYASFMATVMACLKTNGQMITITPRSFTNGLYFKGFRKYLLTQSGLELVHIFKRRNKVFKNKNSSVLQENIICRFIKGKEVKVVTIRSSDCDEKINSADEASYPVDLIIDPSNDQRLIRIPESSYEASILKQAETFPTTFENAGYFISTGPVVEHRTRKFITKETGIKNTVPLYRPHNVIPLLATWDGAHKKDASFQLDDGYEKHMLKNDTYVLLKRFSSKDEKRRLVAGVHLVDRHDCKLIGFGNKTNYIGVVDSKLSTVEAYGLAAVFNSSYMDRYFRCMSGNTQVNATEIRVMKFPSREQVKDIGKNVLELNSYDVNEIDSIVHHILGVKVLF